MIADDATASALQQKIPTGTAAQRIMCAACPACSAWCTAPPYARWVVLPSAVAGSGNRWRPVVERVKTASAAAATAKRPRRRRHRRRAGGGVRHRAAGRRYPSAAATTFTGDGPGAPAGYDGAVGAIGGVCVDSTGLLLERCSGHDQMLVWRWVTLGRLPAAVLVLAAAVRRGPTEAHNSCCPAKSVPAVELRVQSMVVRWRCDSCFNLSLLPGLPRQFSYADQRRRGRPSGPRPRVCRPVAQAGPERPHQTARSACTRLRHVPLSARCARASLCARAPT